MNEQVSNHLLELLSDATEAVGSMRPVGFDDISTILIPKNPIHFSLFVHFIEKLNLAYQSWFQFLRVQGTHQEEDIQCAETALNRVAQETRSFWEQYKAENGIGRSG